MSPRHRCHRLFFGVRVVCCVAVANGCGTALYVYGIYTLLLLVYELQMVPMTIWGHQEMALYHMPPKMPPQCAGCYGTLAHCYGQQKTRKALCYAGLVDLLEPYGTACWCPRRESKCGLQATSCKGLCFCLSVYAPKNAPKLVLLAYVAHKCTVISLSINNK